jgi:ABC-2 type transport system ATP-binding protein
VLEVVERLCDRVIILDHGRIIADGNLEELRRSVAATTLEEIFKRLTSEEDSRPRVEQFAALMR